MQQEMQTQAISLKKKVKITLGFDVGNDTLDGYDTSVEKNLLVLLFALFESVLEKYKKVAIIRELHKNAKLTDEFKEAAVAEIQKRLGKNANLSKELVAASLEKAINENPEFTQEQRDFYLSKLNDKDFMDKFYDILSIKDKESIANKAKSSNELLALVNESFGNNFAKAKEKISESKIDTYMEYMEAKKWQGVTMISNATADEFTREIIAELKANGDLPKSFGSQEDEPSGPRQPRQ